jgi:succinate-semialdehyde dehydrogenase/glutarate-semialdehyde dehydrogenase
MVGINSMSVAHPSLPFGGVKDSGIGREGAYDGLLDSMVTKSISIGRQGA